MAPEATCLSRRPVNAWLGMLVSWSGSQESTMPVRTFAHAATAFWYLQGPIHLRLTLYNL